MKKYLLLFSVIVLGLSACKKGGDVTTEQASIDDRKIQAFIAANYKTTNFTKDPSGVYYSVVTPGAGTTYPTVSSKVQVAYTGKYLNGDTFDSSGSVILTLTDVIKGWQIGLLHVTGRKPDGTGTAGRIILLIPSALAYGPSGNSVVPPNSPLMFTIDLIGIAN